MEFFIMNLISNMKTICLRYFQHENDLLRYKTICLGILIRIWFAVVLFRLNFGEIGEVKMFENLTFFACMHTCS
jgi:hypothetical protein